MTFWDRWHREFGLGIGFAALICVIRAAPDGGREPSFMAWYYLVVAGLLTYASVRLWRRGDSSW
jgi:hypothetical protein